MSEPAADSDSVRAITEALANPFDPSEVKWKPQSVKGNRALAMGYVDARVVQDRLDDVMGIENWQDKYQFLPDGSVVCELTVKLGDRWITKVDVGGQSEQPDGGDRVKAAVSDALKRAAVKFGIGRYLYRLPAQWADYDPVKKQFVQPPKLPPSAMPRPQTHHRELPPSPPPPALPAAKSGPVPAQPALPLKDHAPAKSPRELPKTWQEFLSRITDLDQQLVREGSAPVGLALADLTEVAARDKARKYSGRVMEWPLDAIPYATEVVTEFVKNCRRKWAVVDRYREVRCLDGRNAVVQTAGPLLGWQDRPQTACDVYGDRLTDLAEWCDSSLAVPTR